MRDGWWRGGRVQALTLLLQTLVCVNGTAGVAGPQWEQRGSQSEGAAGESDDRPLPGCQQAPHCTRDVTRARGGGLRLPSRCGDRRAGRPGSRCARKQPSGRFPPPGATGGPHAIPAPQVCTDPLRPPGGRLATALGFKRGGLSPGLPTQPPRSGARTDPCSRTERGEKRTGKKAVEPSGPSCARPLPARPH